MKYNILVVGGTGFIGKNFITLLKKKRKFNIYSLSQKKIDKKSRDKNVKYIFCKIQNKNQLKKKLRYNFDFVVNLAGHKHHKEFKKTYQTHYLGLKYLVDILFTKKIKKFIQVGSCLEYGYTKSPQSEKKIVKISKLKSVFGRSKLKSTNYIMKLYTRAGFPCLVLRPYLIYGPGQSFERLIPYVIKKCLNNESFNLTSGKQLRNLIYINDFINILYKCLFIKTQGEIFNVGSSKNYKIKFIIDYIHKLVKKGFPKFGMIKLRKDEPMNLYPDLKKINKYVKLKSEVTIKEGLKKTILFIKKCKL